MAGETISYVGSARDAGRCRPVTPCLVVAMECRRPRAMPARLWSVLTRSVLAVLLLVAAACGDDSRQQPSGPVTVRATNLYITSDTEVAADVPAGDLTAFRVRANGERVFLEKEVLPGEVARFPTAPDGIYYVPIEPVIVADGARSVDVSRVILGRADASLPPAPVTFGLQLGNLAPWQAADELQLYSPGASVWSPSAVGTPVVGESTLDSSINYSALGLGAIESNKGDRAFVTQLRRRMLGGLEYLALARGTELPDVDMVASTDLSVQADMTDVDATLELALDWRISRFDAMRLEHQPILVTTVYDLLITTLPRARDYGHYGASADLVYARWTELVNVDVAGSVSFGNMFPSEWDVVATLISWYPVAFELPGTLRTTIWDAYWVRAMASDVDGHTVSPLLGPPRNARVADGVVRWEPPDFGTADWYELRVYGLRDNDGLTSAGLEATLYTTGTRLRLPADLLDPSTQAFTVQIAAISEGGAQVDSPLVRTLPCAYASTLTGAVDL